MLSSRRILLLRASATKTTTRPSRRVYLTSARPPRGAPQQHQQHVRGYQSSLTNPYFANPVQLVEPAATKQQQQQETASSFWRQFAAWYSQKLTTHPLTTKSLTGALIAAAGDVLCQAGTYNKAKNDDQPFWQAGWDFKRSFHFFLLGGTFVAPTSHYWYGNLAIHPWTKGQSFQQISKRVALDQFVWSPVFFVIWLTGFWGLETKGNITSQQLTTDLQVALPDVMVANWILWIPCQYANFYAVPVKYQVLFTNLVELVWNAYLSFATEGGGHGHGGGGGEEKKQIEEAEENDQLR